MADRLWKMIVLLMLSSSLLASAAEHKTCDIASQVVDGDPFCNSNGVPVSEYNASFADGLDLSQKCDDSCHCHRVVGWQQVKEECSLRLLRESIPFSGVILHYWDKTVLKIDELHMYVNSYLALHFDQPPPTIEASSKNGVFLEDKKFVVKNEPFTLLMSTRATHPLPEATKKKLQDIFGVKEYDCLASDRDAECNTVVGDFVLDHDDAAIPANMAKAKNFYGCFRLLGSPISCEDLAAFFSQITVECHNNYHSVYYPVGDNRMEKCIRENKAFEASLARDGGRGWQFGNMDIPKAPETEAPAPPEEPQAPEEPEGPDESETEDATPGEAELADATQYVATLNMDLGLSLVFIVLLVCV